MSDLYEPRRPPCTCGAPYATHVIRRDGTRGTSGRPGCTGYTPKEET